MLDKNIVEREYIEYSNPLQSTNYKFTIIREIMDLENFIKTTTRKVS
jgi:hypothetical protein